MLSVSQMMLSFSQQTIRGTSFSKSQAIRFGTESTVSSNWDGMPDLKTAWQSPSVKQAMERVFLEDLFRHTPELGQQFVGKITSLCQNPDLDNASRFKTLRSCYVEMQEQHHLKRSFSDHAVERVARRVKQFVTLLKEVCPGFQPKSMVDVGAGDGLITEGMGKGWQIDPQQVVGLDIFPPEKPLPGMRHVTYDGVVFPFEDKKHDLATIISVLHHVSHYETMLKETFRILKPGGKLLVRDFNANTPDLKLFNHIMDMFYYRVFADLPDVPNPGCFLPEEQWESLLTRIGFRKIQHAHPETLAMNPYNPFIGIYEKPAEPPEGTKKRQAQKTIRLKKQKPIARVSQPITSSVCLI